MGRQPKRTTQNPDERSGWNRYAPMSIILGIVAAIAALVVFLMFIT
jgi:hypothetical protein